jgi:hypothetical protein
MEWPGEFYDWRDAPDPARSTEQVADGRKVLQLGDDVTLVHQRRRLVHGRCVDAFGALQRHALWPLEEQEVLQRPLAEGHQRQVHGGGIVARGSG